MVLFVNKLMNIQVPIDKKDQVRFFHFTRCELDCYTILKRCLEVSFTYTLLLPIVSRFFILCAMRLALKYNSKTLFPFTFVVAIDFKCLWSLWMYSIRRNIRW